MKTNRCFFAVVVAAVLIAPALQAQAPDSLLAVSHQGQSRFRVNIDGGAVWGGVFDDDISGAGVPRDGSGTRMMWYARKGAFRAGGINGTQWDAANIGKYSVAIGQDVRASGDYGVAFGLRTTAANSSSFAVGEDNTASGFASVAMGYRAHTNTKRGSFVFSDNISAGSPDSVRAEYPAQALWRVSCGMQIYTNQAKTSGVGIGGVATNPTVCTGGSAYWGQANAMISTSTGAYLHTSGTWTNSSDVNRKHYFESISGEDVLAKMRRLPITSWSYKVDGRSIRHIGPTAQDFRAAFGLGADDVSIATVDADGVALAGVAALEARTRTQGTRIESLERENADLRKRLEKLESIILQSGEKK